MSESVGVGHPDKIADQIADAIVDEAMRFDIDSSVNCKVIISANLISIFGFVVTKGLLNYKKIVNLVLEPLGYDVNKFSLRVYVKNQKAPKVQDFLSVVGFACDENSENIPMSWLISGQLMSSAERLIKSGALHWAKYDMKALLVLKKEEGFFEAKKLIYSIQHLENKSLDEIKKDIFSLIVEPIFKERKINFDEKNIFINPSEKFVIGGLDADSGATNRKLMVDAYGVNVRSGGNGLSGKDLTKIERLGTYYARWICKNLVCAKICKFIELVIVYKEDLLVPYKYEARFNEDCEFSEIEIIEGIKRIFPQDIVEVLDIFRSMKDAYSFRNMSRYGHVGLVFCGNVPWENLDYAEDLKKYFFN